MDILVEQIVKSGTLRQTIVESGNYRVQIVYGGNLGDCGQ